ncbi:unnamed protein product, partial [Mesorhabditis belari]|uniref:Ionotropic glutamate receptor C-terminal domain-containing protein n=1 Tax=Mesorhabditis belari TaxID=2138241 RepID=A0AAF3EIC6_9BILA
MDPMPRKIRVLFPRNPPDNFDNCKDFPTFTPSIECLFPGWTLEIIHSITQALQLIIEPVFMDAGAGEVNWGTLVNNTTWYGALSYLQNNQVDVISLLYQQTAVRAQWFEYSYPVTSVQEVINVQEADKAAEASIWDAMKPFDNTVWGIFLASMVIQIVCFVIVRKAENQLFDEKEGLWETVWSVLAFQLNQFQDKCNFYTNSGRLMLTMFGICHLVLFLGLYQSYLISALLQDTASKPFNNLEEMVALVKDGNYELLKILNGNWIYDDISVSPLFKDLRSALVKHPYFIVNDSMKALDKLDRGKYVMFNQIDSYATLELGTHCNIITITEGLPQKTAHFLFQPNSSFVNGFNKQIIMQQSFILRTYMKYFDSGFRIYKPTNCEEKLGVNEYQPLGFKNCMGIFVILLIGWVACPFAFAVELITFKFYNRAKKLVAVKLMRPHLS